MFLVKVLFCSIAIFRAGGEATRCGGSTICTCNDQLSWAGDTVWASKWVICVLQSHRELTRSGEEDRHIEGFDLGYICLLASLHISTFIYTSDRTEMTASFNGNSLFLCLHINPTGT